MLSLLFPHEYAPTIWEIDFQELYRQGYRGLMFDIDNTLVPHGADSTPEVDAFFENLGKMGFTSIMLSNNDKERVTRFLKNIEASYVCDAEKPRPAKYLEAVEKLGMDKAQVVCIGDQVFTDVLGANLAKIPCILVHFIRKPGERKIGIRRRTEQVVLWIYFHTKRYRHRLGKIVPEDGGWIP